MLVIQIGELRKEQATKTSVTKNSHILGQSGNKNYQYVCEIFFEFWAIITCQFFEIKSVKLLF